MMYRPDILESVKDLIVEVSYAERKLISPKDKLNKYLPAPAGTALTMAAIKKFETIDLSKLSNSLFITVNTVEELVEFIEENYN